MKNIKNILLILCFSMLFITACDQETILTKKTNSVSDASERSSSNGASILDASELNQGLFSEFILACTGNAASGVFVSLVSPMSSKYGALKFETREDYFAYQNNYYELQKLWDQSDEGFFSENWYSPLKAVEQHYNVELLGNYYAHIDWYEGNGTRVEIEPFRLNSPDDLCGLSKYRDVVIGEEVAYFKHEGYLAVYPDIGQNVVDNVREDNVDVPGARLIDMTWHDFTAESRTSCGIAMEPRLKSANILSHVVLQDLRLQAIDENGGFIYLGADYTINWGDGNTESHNKVTRVFNPFHNFGQSPPLGGSLSFDIEITAVVDDSGFTGDCGNGQTYTRNIRVIFRDSQCNENEQRGWGHYLYESNNGQKAYQVLMDVQYQDTEFVRQAKFWTTIEHKKYIDGKWRRNRATELDVFMEGEYWDTDGCRIPGRDYLNLEDQGHDKWCNTVKESFGFPALANKYTADIQEAPRGMTHIVTNGETHEFGPLSIYD